MSELTKSEIKIGKTASQRLGFRVIVYRDGNWICQPYGDRLNGYGDTPQEAEEDCRKRNTGFKSFF